MDLVVPRMRHHRIHSIQSPSFGLVLLPELPSAPTEDDKKAKLDPFKDRREHYEQLFGRKVTDAELKMLP